MKILYDSSENFFKELQIHLESRPSNINNNIDLEVRNIINDVKKKGDKALFYYSKKFEKADLNKSSLKISSELKKKYKEKTQPEKLNSFKIAIENITNFHKQQLPKNYEINENGIRKGILWKPIQSVGLYVPGGKAIYPSSLIMNVVPAKVAGVKRIVVVTPGQNSSINPYIIALLDILNIEEAYQVGGVQAIAALAYGTESIKPVDKIFGPGNAYVANAKKQVFGKVGIDLIAGPSEIVVIADSNNNPQWVAADLIAQAEHDENAQAILITDSKDFYLKVEESINNLLDKLPRKTIIQKSINNFGITIIVNDFIKVSGIVNLIAPEHLHIHNDSYKEIFDNIDNAGSIFIGPYSCEAFGDYVVGTNHILPTYGSSKFASGLGVTDFLKRISYVEMNEKSSNVLEKHVSNFAEIEDLYGHKLSVKIRQKVKK